MSNTHLHLYLKVPQYLSDVVQIRFVAQSIGFYKFRSLGAVEGEPQYSSDLKSVNLQAYLGKVKKLFMENWFVFVFSEWK